MWKRIGSFFSETDDLEIEEQSQSTEAEELAFINNNDQEILDIFQRQVTRIANMEQQMTRLTESTMKLDTINTELHKENQSLKEGFYKELTLPYLKEMIEIAEDLMKEINNRQKKGMTEVAEALEEVLEDSIQLVLERHSIFSFQAEEEAIFDPLKHRLVHKIPTEEQHKNKRIAKCLGYGYIQKTEEKETLLCPCKVDAYSYSLKSEIKK